MIATLHDIAVLRAPADAFRHPEPADLQLRELSRNQIAEIQKGHIAQGRKIPPRRIERRLNHDLRFFQLWKGNTLAASTWIAHGTPRYIDELSLAFPMSADELWVRDVFVAPEMRGMKLFIRLLSAIVAEAAPDCSALWSDVDWVNKTSIRAHTSAGFAVQSRLRALDLGRRIRIRSLPPAWHLPITELVPDRRLILWNEALRHCHSELIA